MLDYLKTNTEHHYTFDLARGCCILKLTETEDVFHYSLKMAF